MSWSDFYRRRDAMDAVLEYARRNPEAVPPFAEKAAQWWGGRQGGHREVAGGIVPDVAEIFAGPEELLLAMHYRWTMKLTGQVSLAQAEAELDPRIDRVDAVAAAWRATAAEFPVLRRLLDANADSFGVVLRPAVDGEQRMLALAAGLAEPHESPQEITRIGASFLALLRSTPDRHARRRNPVEQLLRRLVASA